MDNVEKSVLFWMLSSMAASLAFSTGDTEYYRETREKLDELMDKLGDYYGYGDD